MRSALERQHVAKRRQVAQRMLSACAIRECESRIGWACCMCVMPDKGTCRLAFAAFKKKPFSKSQKAVVNYLSAAASMTKRPEISAKSRLRLRPVCNFQPRGPSSSTRDYHETDAHYYAQSRNQPSFYRYAPAERRSCRRALARVCRTSNFVEDAYSLQRLAQERSTAIS